MTRSLITLVTCPFCPRGWGLSVDLTALRAVEGPRPLPKKRQRRGS